MEEISQEAIDRMVAFVRDCARLTRDYRTFVGGADCDDERRLADEVRAIIALLPKPVDPDLEQAKALAFEFGWGCVADDSKITLTLLSALARGRELAKARAGEGSGE